MISQKEGYKYFISGIKGVACFFIMLGHFIGIYKYAQSFPQITILDKMLASPLSFLIDERYWLYLFLVISGYLVAGSNIKNGRDVINKIINRFFRLGIPILFSFLIVYILYKVCGFYNAETITLFQCDWFQNIYPDSFAIKDVILGPINVLLFGNYSLIAPYWMLKNMFIASSIIYILKYCSQRFMEEKSDAVCFSILMVITFGSGIYSPIITACLMGMMVALFEKTEIIHTPCFAAWMMIVFMCIYFLPKVIVASVFFCSLLVFIPKVKNADRFFSGKPLQLFGNISWGIYSFHWPVICSIGSIIIIRLAGKIGLAKAYAGSFVIVVLFTVAISIGYYYTFEKLSVFLVNKIMNFIRNIIK